MYYKKIFIELILAPFLLQADMFFQQLINGQNAYQGSLQAFQT
jgi:hypothetical protein